VGARRWPAVTNPKCRPGYPGRHLPLIFKQMEFQK
jgi:hypothetical protein